MPAKSLFFFPSLNEKLIQCSNFHMAKLTQFDPTKFTLVVRPDSGSICHQCHRFVFVFVEQHI